MRLQKYITEKTVDWVDTEKIYDILRKNVKKSFLDTVSKDGFLYRGHRLSLSDDITVKSSRLENRQTMNMRPAMHMTLNKLFEEKFGWKVRNGVFTSTKEIGAKSYGYLYIFFPIGEYKFVYSPKVSDLFVELRLDTDDDEFRKIVNTYTDKNLAGAFEGVVKEVIFNCEKYYLVKPYISWLEFDAFK